MSEEERAFQIRLIHDYPGLVGVQIEKEEEQKQEATLNDFLESIARDWLHQPRFILTKENVNMIIHANHGREYSLLELLVDSKKCTPQILQEFLRYNPIIDGRALDRCVRFECFKMLLQHAEDVNKCMIFKERHLLCYTVHWYRQKIIMLCEYNVDIPLKIRLTLNNEHHAMLHEIRCDILARENNCRRALLTLIWITKQSGLQPLKPLFIKWSRWIWSLKPYTNDLLPNVGPRSPVWNLSE